MDLLLWMGFRPRDTEDYCQKIESYGCDFDPAHGIVHVMKVGPHLLHDRVAPEIVLVDCDWGL